MKKIATEPCEYCSGRVRPGRVTVDWRRGRELVVIEGVPAGVCDQCGERYYDANVVRRLEGLVKRRSRAKRRLAVPVLPFGAVA